MLFLQAKTILPMLQIAHQKSLIPVGQRYSCLINRLTVVDQAVSSRSKTMCGTLTYLVVKQALADIDLSAQMIFYLSLTEKEQITVSQIHSELRELMTVKDERKFVYLTKGTKVDPETDKCEFFAYGSEGDEVLFCVYPALINQTGQRKPIVLPGAIVSKKAMLDYGVQMWTLSMITF